MNARGSLSLVRQCGSTSSLRATGSELSVTRSRYETSSTIAKATPSTALGRSNDTDPSMSRRGRRPRRVSTSHSTGHRVPVRQAVQATIGCAHDGPGFEGLNILGSKRPVPIDLGASVSNSEIRMCGDGWCRVIQPLEQQTQRGVLRITAEECELGASSVLEVTTRQRSPERALVVEEVCGDVQACLVADRLPAARHRMAPYALYDANGKPPGDSSEIPPGAQVAPQSTARGIIGAAWRPSTPSRTPGTSPVRSSVSQLPPVPPRVLSPSRVHCSGAVHPVLASQNPNPAAHESAGMFRTIDNHTSNHLLAGTTIAGRKQIHTRSSRAPGVTLRAVPVEGTTSGRLYRSSEAVTSMSGRRSLLERFRWPTPSYGSRSSWYQRVSIQRSNLRPTSRSVPTSS